MITDEDEEEEHEGDPPVPIAAEDTTAVTIPLGEVL